MEEEYTEQEAQDPKDRLDRILALAQSLLRKRDDAITARAEDGCEARWEEDEKAFDECVDSDVSSKSSFRDVVTGRVIHKSDSKKGSNSSNVVVNIIRGRTEICAGRLADTITPTSDRNWGLENTPDPDLDEATYSDEPASRAISNIGNTQKPDGTEATLGDIAKQQKEAASKAMSGMETEIDDQLTECRFNAECRKVMFSAAKLGTGILKGPVVIRRTNSKWTKVSDGTGETWTQKIVEENTPVSVSVDPWNFYPAPGCGDDIKRAPYVWEKGEILPRELRKLTKLQDQGYIPEIIEQVLASQPKRTTTTQAQKGIRVTHNLVDKGHAYEQWEYHGDVDSEDLEAMGIDPETLNGEAMTACVIFVNDLPIKAALYPIDSSDLIYDVFQWSKVSNSIFGIGIPRQAGWAQRVITAAWRSMMDNGREMAGANIVMKRGLELQDTLGNIRVWIAPKEEADIRQIFGLFQVANNQEALQKIIELSLKFFDLETTTPTIFQGEKAELPKTLGQTNIMVDSANIATRNRAIIWDDQITVPHLTRYYDWNMQNPEAPNEIKGEYKVSPRGARELVERDQQAALIADVLQLKQDPDFQGWVDWKKVLRLLFASKRLDVMKSDLDIKQWEAQQQQAPPPQNPALEVANVRVQGELEKAKLVQGSDMQELKFKADDAQTQREHELRIKEYDVYMKQLEYEMKTGIALDKNKVDLAKEASRQNLQKELSDKKYNGPQVASPTIEPAGRAREGRAFQE